jgi:hypothetical protein
VAGILLLGAPVSSFNGGRSQGQSARPGLGNDFPFINLLKQASNWKGKNAANDGQVIAPSWLGTDGYPTAAAFVGSGGMFQNVVLPPNTAVVSDTNNPMVVTWEGNSAINIVNAASTTVGGSKTAVLNGYGFSDGKYHGRYVWYPTYAAAGTYSFQFTITAITDYISDIKLYFLSDETDVLAGKMFAPQFLSVLRQAKFGIYRFMDWLFTNTNNVTTWDTRKPVGNPTWIDDEYRASLFLGTTTNSGNDFAITAPGSYVWPGYSGGAPVDKQTAHISFNDDATLVQNGTNSTLTVSSISPITFGWTTHPLSNGDMVGVSTGFIGGSPLGGTGAGTNYYVVNSTANSFQIALTPGGTAINGSGTPGTNIFVTKFPTLNLNGSGAYPLKGEGGAPLSSAALLPTKNGTKPLYGTVVFDADLQGWCLFGGSTGTQSVGIKNSIPIEVCLQLCQELGMHPSWALPQFTLDPMTDYATGLATYCKDHNPGWMIPSYEPGNEVWNPLTPITAYAYNKAWQHWQYTAFDWDNWYGKVLSTLGQAVADVHGLGNLGVTYDVLCGVQTDGGGLPLTSSTFDRLQARQYVAQAAAAQSGYTKSAAYGWTSTILPATYVTPSMTTTPDEYLNTWDYYVTNVGNSVAQLANLNAFAESLGRGFNGTGVLTIASPGVVNWPSHGRTAGDIININSTGTLPPGATSGQYFVKTVLDPDSFTVCTLASGRGGAVVNFTGSQSGTHYVSGGKFPNNYELCRYINWKTVAAALGVNKMMAYEGGYSPDLTTDTSWGNSWASPITGASKAAQCVLTLATTNVQGGVNPWDGNVARVGMVLSPVSVAGMTELNCASGSVIITNGVASMAMTNTFIAGQAIRFIGYSQTLPTNIALYTTYYVIATGLSGSAFQISATKGGAAITPSGGGTFTIASGWVVTGVAGNSVTIDVDSTGFTTYTSGGSARYVDSTKMVNNFRVASLLYGTGLKQQLLDNMNNFVAAGGTFPSQYQLAGDNSIWFIVQPTIWGTKSYSFQAIEEFNA